MKIFTARKLGMGLMLSALALAPVASFAGTWLPLSTSPAEGIGTMLLLSDGTVMAQGGGGGHTTTTWYRLKPGSGGGYTNGAWSSLASMNYNRLYFSSDVLPNGKVFVAGAEYGNGTTNAELYNPPPANSWSIIPIPSGIINKNNTINTNDGANTQGFIDSGSVVLNNGKVLVLPVRPASGGFDSLYNPGGNSWSTTGREGNGSDEDEASTVKLPDDSILVVDSGSQNSERYLPASNLWTNDAAVPVDLYDVYGGEAGAAFLLPNGKAFFIGSTPSTALYTPSGNNGPGTWKSGPAIPNNQGAPDAPAAMMPNGKILCAFSPTPFNGSNVFTTPTTFYEYNYSSGSVGSFTQVNAPGGGLTDGNPTFVMRMLDLPDGTVLFTDGGSQLYVYVPGGTPLAAGRPVITGTSWNSDGSLQVSGTLFNGISQGAAYGDDAQMDSNYPLVRFVDGSGNVTYGRSYNWSSTSVQTGNETISASVTMPASLAPGNYSLQVVANGNASASVGFYNPVWVNFNYSGTQIGTYANPFSTLGGGVSAVYSGGTILINSAVQPSQSPETMTISKPMTILSVNGPATIGN